MTQKKQISPSKHFCFTAHDITLADKWKTFDLEENKIRYIVFQKEQCPKTKKFHLQGYVEFLDKIRYSTVNKRLGQCHVEKRKGNRQQARDYCMKSESQVESPIERGEWKTKQGTRTDLEDLVEDITKNDFTLAQVYDKYPVMYFKYSRHVKNLINQRDRKRINLHKNIIINVLWGPSRSGKTRYVFDKHGPENVYVAQVTEDGKLWFDGYDGESVLLINEFYGQLRTNYMQNLLDNYSMKLNVKGGHAISNWDYIYITSNCCPSEWYSNWEKIPDEVARSFYNRFDNIIEFKKKVQEKKSWSWSDKKSTYSPGANKKAGPIITPATSGTRTKNYSIFNPPSPRPPKPSLFDRLSTTMIDTILNMDVSTQNTPNNLYNFTPTSHHFCRSLNDEKKQ